MGSLRVYHQGGLDTYCGFYSVLNLINFLHWRNNPNADEPGDFIGAAGDGQPFEKFRGLVGNKEFCNIFHALEPFGGEGIEAPALYDALKLARDHFHFEFKAHIAEDLEVGIEAEKQNEFWFRIGAERPFVDHATDVLGIAAVKEDEDDELLHWVVVVGKNHLEATDIECGNYWNGVVLDSCRGYKFWKCEHANGLPRLRIKRDNEPGKVIYCIYSFISVAPA